MSRAELDVNNVFLEKKLDAMKRRHMRAEELYENVRIYQDANDKKLWIVPSFSQIGEIYKVRRLSLKHHTCDLYCDECEACVHQYSCDCPDSVTKSSFCKHMHVVCLNTPTDFYKDSDNEAESIEIDENDKEKDSSSRNLERNRNKSLRQEAKTALLGFVPELDKFTSNEAFEEIIQTMKSLRSKCEAIWSHEECISPEIDICT